MSKNLTTKRIGDYTYMFQKLDAVDGTEMSILIALQAAALMTALVDDKPDDDIGIADSLKAFGNAKKTMDAKTLTEIIVTACQSCRVKSDEEDSFKPVDYSSHFADGLARAFPVAFFALRYNFKDFIPDLQNIMSEMDFVIPAGLKKVMVDNGLEFPKL